MAEIVNGMNFINIFSSILVCFASYTMEITKGAENKKKMEEKMFGSKNEIKAIVMAAMVMMAAERKDGQFIFREQKSETIQIKTFLIPIRK